jgi:hypothetical protein
MDAVSALSGWLQRHDARLDGRDTSDWLPAIIASIDRGVPVLGYPSAEHMDLGVLFGYERHGDDLQLCWLDYQREGELVLPAQRLGGLLVLLERQGNVPDSRRALIAALHNDNWRRRERAVPGRDGAYTYGALAFETWCSDLELAARLPEPQRRKLCFVSWFCFAALVDARSAAATFLNQAAGDFEDEIASALRAAAACYAAGCGAMLPAIRDRDAFQPPWGAPGLSGWDDATRAREQAILQQVRTHDAAAERALDSALTAAARD